MRRKCRVIFYSVVGRYEPIFSRIFCRLFRTGCYIFTFVKDIHILKRLEAIASSLFNAVRKNQVYYALLCCISAQT